ncbi:MAG: efflux RND transporter periplasmic adaptor subunit [Planctomycetes bacterium]|nr:efflux RND transporter periplasmic adaptor subunit [Planctomycetota bacterium]
MSKKWTLLLPVLLLAACGGGGGETPPAGGGEGEPVKITNRIDIPPAVVQNLGITFAKVERRRVEQTLRVPGNFESPPEARREYHTMLPGRVEVLVKQYQLVEPGTELFRLESPEWRRMQESLAATDVAISTLQSDRSVLDAERAAAVKAIESFPPRIDAQRALMDASDDHLMRLGEARDNWLERVAQIEELQKRGAGKAAELAEARAELQNALVGLAEEQEKRAGLAEQRANLDAEKAAAELAIPVIDSHIAAKDAEIVNARDAMQRALKSAAGALGMTAQALAEGDAWRTLDTFTVRATAVGTVDHVHASTGAWVEANTEIIATVDLTNLRFRGRALQSDLGLLKEGLPTRVVPPQGGSLENATPAEGTLYIPVEADPGERMIDLLAVLDSVPDWARPGVSGELEVVWNTTTEPQLAIPNRAIVRDGLDQVFFVRDYKDDNKVIRTVSPLGVSDGRWTVVDTGVMEGSEVVIEGVYELKLTGGGKPLGKGHFHADGTWHAGADHD